MVAADQDHDSKKIIYVDYDKNENARNIFICNAMRVPLNPKYIDQLEKFDEKNFNHISSEKIKIKNNKMNFFVPFDFDKTEAAQQFRFVSIESEKYEERAVKCLNGEYEIKLFVDDVFLENKKKLG